MDFPEYRGKTYARKLVQSPTSVLVLRSKHLAVLSLTLSEPAVEHT